MTQPGIEHWSPGPLVNTLTIILMGWFYIYIYIYVCVCVCVWKLSTKKELTEKNIIQSTKAKNNKNNKKIEGNFHFSYENR